MNRHVTPTSGSRRSRRGCRRGAENGRVAVAGAVLAIVAAFGDAGRAQVKPYDWRETTGVSTPVVQGHEARESADTAPPAPVERPLTSEEIDALVEAERTRSKNASVPRESPFSPTEQFAREAQAIADDSTSELEARRKTASDRTAAPALSAELIDAGARLDRIGTEVGGRVTLVAKSVSVLLFLVALLLWYTGIFTTGQFSNPVMLLGRAAVAFVLLVGTPFMMASLEALCAGAARAIDDTFSGAGADGGSSAITEIYRKVGRGIETHWEDYDAQTLRADDAAGEFVQTSWRIATMFYLILKAVWDFLWVVLRIVAPLSAVAFMINAEFGGRIFSAWLRNTLNVASWPIGWAIVFGLMNAGVDDWARTEPGTLYQIAFLCYMLALLVVSVPVLVSLFWNGEGVSGMLANFGTGVADGFLRAGLTSAGGALPALGFGTEASGAMALDAWEHATSLGGAASRSHGFGHMGRNAHTGGWNRNGVPSAGGSLQTNLAGLLALASGRREIGERLLEKAGFDAGSTPRGTEPGLSPHAENLSTGDPPAVHDPCRAGGLPDGARSRGREAIAVERASASSPREESPVPDVVLPSVPSGSGGSTRTGPVSEPDAPREDPLGISARWGASVRAEDFGRSHLDPRGESVVDAGGRRVYVGDSVTTKLESGGSGAPSTFSGRVLGFRKDENGHRVPVVRGHEIDDESHIVSGERDLVVGDWYARPGFKVAPVLQQPPARENATRQSIESVADPSATGHPYI
jgi:hypothetical protein